MPSSFPVPDVDAFTLWTRATSIARKAALFLRPRADIGESNMHISPTSVSSIFAKNRLSARFDLKALTGLALAVTFATSSVAQTPTPCPGSTPTNFPAAGVVRAVGNYFSLNGRFYVMGGRSSDTPGSDFANPFEYNPATNTWTIKVATYPDNQVNNMACAVLTAGGTPQIYCVGG